MELPEGKQLGFFFNIATGKQLDIFGKSAGVKRKKWLFFHEPDYLYKRRIIEAELKKKASDQ